MHIQRQAIIIGAGDIGKIVLSSLPEEWNITIIDTDQQALDSIPDTSRIGTRTKLCADASSRLVLRDINLNQTSLLAVLTDSDRVNQEIVRLAKEEFFVEEIFLLQNTLEAEVVYENISTTTPSTLIGHRIANRMRGTLSAQGIGQERGEIRQITVLNSSPARGLPLKEIKPQSWLVAAIYRQGDLVIPHGDTIIRSGDQIVVVGEPHVLEVELPFLRGGQIIFPSQYGEVIGYIDEEQTQHSVEIFLDKTQAESKAELHFSNLNPNRNSAAEIRQILVENKIGLIALPFRKIHWSSRWGFRPEAVMTLMFNSQIPFLFSKKELSPKKVLLCIKSQRSLRVMTTIALDVARQFEAELTILSVYPPNIDQNQRNEIEKLPIEVEILARAHGMVVRKQYAEGNPIQEIQKVATEYDVAVVGFSQHKRSTFMNPDISLHLLHRAPCSLLFVPWQTAGR